MQVKFLGGTFHNQTLKVPGEMQDLPSRLRNPLSDANEVYDRRDIRRGDGRDVVYVLSGFQPTGIDLAMESPASSYVPQF